MFASYDVSKLFVIHVLLYLAMALENSFGRVESMERLLATNSTGSR